MAMTVINNPTAMMTLGELNKNVSKLGKQLSKLANGQKIVGAGDGTSDYSISERMQAQIRSLKQDIDNTKTGRSMLQVAEGGIQGIVDELREMKQLTINAANDSNTDADRATIQKEFDEKLKQIDDIVATTHYNGKLLLNGEYGRLHNSIVNENTDGINGDTGATGEISTGVIEPNGNPTLISSGPYTITAAGVYVLGANYTGDISIADGLVGVKIKQATPAQLNNVHIIGPASGNANLWIEGLNIKNVNNVDQSWIRFSGSDNVLSIKGNNKLNYSFAYGQAVGHALINIGEGLIMEGNGSLEITHIDVGGDAGLNTDGAIIGTDTFNSSYANLTINSGKYFISTSGGGAGIGSGAYSSIGDIRINGGSYNIKNYGGGAALGSGTRATAGAVIIRNSNFVGKTDDGACIGSGSQTDANVREIIIENSVINVASVQSMPGNDIYNTGCGAGIGSGHGSQPGGGFAKAGDITIRNSTVFSSSNGGAGIGSGRFASAGNITIENITGLVTSINGEAVGRGVDGTVGTIALDGYTEIPLPEGEPDIPDSSISNGKFVLYNPLIVHTGTKANQRINCYIENLGTKALFNVRTDEELEKLANVRTRDSAQRLLGSLTDPSIEGPLDKAINYALNEVTQVGAYIKRLEQTENTLTINQENTTSSESTIRDADMAKEMMEYTKRNVLTQAAQSMLAQANQNSSSVLSLLQ